MKESKKESSCPPSTKDKNSLLDEEIGMEFLSSWKTSVTGDNSLDLGFDTVSTGKKNKFNFEKLDIDFDLDGDFGKLSSFKVDMSDLDFSCPLKQAAKPKEGSARKSPGGKLEQEQFTFSFDFNELENFDFKTATMEGEKTSLNNLNNKEIVPNNKERDVSNGSADPFDDGKIEKLQKSTDVSTSKAHSAVNDNVDSALDVSKTGDFSNENIHLGVANSEGLVMPSVESPVQGKTATDNQEEDQQNHSSEKPMSKSTGSFIQQTMTSPDQSIDGNDQAQGVGFSHDISQPMELPQSCLARSDRSQKTDSGTTSQNVSEHDPEIDCLDHETISAESVLQTMPHNNRPSKDSKDSTSKILVQLGSDTVNDNVPQRKEKEAEIVYSKYFNRSRKTESGPDTPSSGGKGVASLSLNRPEKCVDTEQNDCKVVKIPRPADKVVVEGGSFMLGNERKNKSSKKFGECFGVGAEQNIRMPGLLNKEPAKGGSTILGSKKDVKDIKKIGFRGVRLLCAVLKLILQSKKTRD
ncbi:hypothetical protein K2173_000806 [Erythroxylum novogranatense]|uniref:Uncharacterized protein n=1 Tax=Erythroxylum novogranatense TaxID=1862640 RepID=A0AAV8T2Z3_9ROSI|nr:hypothetical protein K2173_000806 [Erythroxylum novogranatense]